MRLSSTCVASLAFFASTTFASIPRLDPLDLAKPFGAVYYITNSLDENFVIAAQIGEDGIATDVKAISANGVGAQGQLSERDALFSQGSVQVNQATSRLAVVNAGSNTIQLFDIDPTNPLNITAIGKPVPSGGDFPQSIAWNNAGTRMCVLNGGLNARVQCFIVDKKGKLTDIASGEITTYNQTSNPPHGPAGTPSQVLFTADQGGVITIAKGLPDDLINSPGYMRVWPLADNGTFASMPFEANITEPIGGMPSSLSQSPGTLVYVGSDGTNGGLVIDMTAGPNHAIFQPIDLPNNVGNSHSVSAPKTGTFFISDPLGDVINEISLGENNNATLVRQYDVPGLGPSEAIVTEIQGQEFMYMLMQGENTLGVWRLDGPGRAVLTQLWEMAVPVRILGLTFDQTLLSGMAIYVSP
ncbi:unnamed protein product [Peniophora sp. CBMAI 1063]|nr:unnamed protein product [Peniophora sp. CBMAI 1063]